MAVRKSNGTSLITASKFLLPLTLEETCKKIVEDGLRIAQAIDGSVFILEQSVLKRVYSTLPQKLQVEPRKDGQSYEAIRTGKIVVIPITNFHRTHPAATVKRQAKAILVIPLNYHNERYGTLSLDCKNLDHLTPIVLSELTDFSFLASLAIKKALFQTETARALETRDRFISMAAHEIRTPLTAISGYVQLINNYTSVGKALKPEWLTELTSATDRLVDLTKNIIDFNRAQNDRLNLAFETINFRETIETAKTRFETRHPERQIELTHVGEKALYVVADKAKIIDTVTRLLDNADKFSPLARKIILKVSRSSTQTTLEVNNFGKKISDDDLPHIFEGYYRDKENRRESIGLGLYLVKAIVTAHRGKITVNSSPTKTTFVLKFPLKK